MCRSIEENTVINIKLRLFNVFVWLTFVDIQFTLLDHSKCRNYDVRLSQRNVKQKTKLKKH